MNPDRLPWEIIETLPHSDAETLATWHERVVSAATDDERVRALVGRALATYWAPALGLVEDGPEATRRQQGRDIDDAEQLARRSGDADLLAVALLGRLYALWGPPDPPARRLHLAELEALRGSVLDPEVRVRIVEWHVLQCFDNGDLAGVREWIDTFLREATQIDSKLFTRREVLWRANLEMLDGRLDDSVRTNEEAIASTADLAGSPFSFQNVAITMAISMYLRRGLVDLLDAIRSIRASSPRVAANWDIGLAFALSESGESDEARALFDDLARDRFATVPRDLNWLVAMTLLGLIAVNLDDRPRAEELLDLLRPHGGLDATHGSGYASYGPVDRVVGLLAARVGQTDEAEARFEAVLSSRSAGPWTALTRADRACARQAADPAGALADAERAEHELAGFGLGTRADAARALASEIRLRGHGGPLAKLAEGNWTLTHPTGHVVVNDGVGMQSLWRLLAHPGDPIDVIDLDSRVDPSMPRASATERSIDASARDAYRQRLQELEQPATTSEEAEREFLRRELAGSAHATPASREIEKTRVRVTTSLRRVIATIAERSPGLGEHLQASIETGRRCSYQPADGTSWRVER